MKHILSILLSFTLFVTGISVPGHTQTDNYPEEEIATDQEEIIPKDKETEINQTEEEEPEQKEEASEENTNPSSETKEPEGETPGNAEEKKEYIHSEQEKFPKEQKETKPQTEGKKPGKEAKQMPETPNEKNVIEKKPAQKQGENDLKLETQDRAAQVLTEQLDQNKAEKILKLKEDESLDSIAKAGYSIEVSRVISCKHTSSDINGSIKCNAAPRKLNPTEAQLKGNVVLTGNLKGKTITKSVENYDAGGEINTVTHKRLKVTVKNAPGIDPMYVAGPYICGDGYAAYAYYEFHYSYCPNTEQYYKVQNSHIWLGCTKGDIGELEYHPKNLVHEFNVYKLVPNRYKVAYDANGGTGTVSGQNATYGVNLTLREGKNYKRTGYTLTGWNTKKNGTGTPYKLSETVKNLTKENGETVTLYAQWSPNVLTIKYDKNKGSVSGTPSLDISSFSRQWNYGGNDQDPVDAASFGLSRVGYTIKRGAEWNTRADGAGTSFDQSKAYAMTTYAPGLANGDQTVILYANWQPNVYTVTLNNQLTSPETDGTGKIYKKYETGIFLDNACSQGFTSEHSITAPKKSGYVFQGYYDSKTDGNQMIDKNGKLTSEGQSRKDTVGNETWHARYDYMITCEDYADIPCDLEKTDGDTREDLSVRITCNSSTRKAAIHTGQTGCSISLAGKTAGTKIGNFQSTLSAGSASGNTGGSQSVELPITILDGTAYQLKATRNGMTICDRLVYYKDGRFRTLAKLGIQETKQAESGSSLAGSAWNKETREYELYQYQDCSELKNIQAPGTVQRYFHYKDVNMAYSGNGATSGTNTLEYDVSLENLYQFRDNGFEKETTEKKYTKDNREYKCEVKYSFQGWEMSANHPEQYTEKQQNYVSEVYNTAERKNAISHRTTEDINTYQTAAPISVVPGLNILNLQGDARVAQGSAADAFKAKGAHAAEYINFQAKWNAFPTIAVNPGDKLEFFEGEEVTKEKIISHLTAHDTEDNKKVEVNPNLNDKLRIIKVVYPEPKNKSQAAYEKTYEEDVPEDFLLDTYYLKLEKDETVDALVTFAVTDSTGNTTEEEIPVKVKYNHYPEIHSDDMFYYMKEEANKGEISADALIGRASADDKEDGDVTGKITLKDFDPQILKMQTESKAEFFITYQVTDAYRKTTYKTVKVMVWDDDAVIAEMPKYYVRYISAKYLDTLEESSTWREPENLAYLKRILNNETPMETWEFTHEDVLAVQKWITEGGEGNWKIGQEANKEFLAKFARCRKQ